MKTKLTITNVLGFVGKLFFKILKRIAAIWDNVPNQIHFCEKFININPIENLYLVCNCKDGSNSNIVKEAAPNEFVLKTTTTMKVHFEPETIRYKKLKKV